MKRNGSWVVSSESGDRRTGVEKGRGTGLGTGVEKGRGTGLGTVLETGLGTKFALCSEELAQMIGQAAREPAGDLARVVGQHGRCAGPPEGEQRLEDHPIAVDPAVGSGRLDHRILAGDLIGADGNRRRLRSEEHTSELHHVAISYAVFC